MTEDERFVLLWLYNTVSKRMTDNPYGSNDIVVNGINVTETVRKLLQELFNIHQPKKWFFGHYHQSWSMTINGTDFRCLNELEIAVLTKHSY